MREFLEQVKSSCSRWTITIFLLQDTVMIQEIVSSTDKVTINSDKPKIKSIILWVIPQAVNKINVAAIATY